MTVKQEKTTRNIPALAACVCYLLSKRALMAVYMAGSLVIVHTDYQAVHWVVFTLAFYYCLLKYVGGAFVRRRYGIRSFPCEELRFSDSSELFWSVVILVETVYVLLLLILW